MKSTFLKYALLLILPVGMLFSSCSKDDDDNATTSGITVKCGTITYDDGAYFVFKNYGKEFYAFCKGTTRTLFDVKASKVYLMDTFTKTYTVTSGSLSVELLSAEIVGHDLFWAAMPGVSKTNVTIAGKTCINYSFTDEGDNYQYAVWSGLVFKVNTGFSSYEAVSFDETEPDASLFSLEGYTELDFAD